MTLRSLVDFAGGSMPGVGPQQGPDPDYPVPWTTNVPREGLREEIKARVICLSPSVNLTPSGGGMVPVPYMIYDECDHPENFSAKTFYTRRRVLRMCSKTSHVHGDEAGTGGGVASGTHGSVCEPISHAAKVRVEGSEVARHLDRFWMNNRNTVGEAVFARDMTIHAAPDDTDPLPGSARVILAGMQSSAAASPQTAPAPQPEPRPSQPLPRPPGEIIRPGPGRAPQWYSPPPEPTTKLSPGKLLRLGRWGGLIVMLLTPTNGAVLDDVVPRDAFEKAVVDEFNKRVSDGVDSWDVREWAMREVRQHRQQQQQSPKPVAPPLPQTAPVRVSKEDEKEQKCLVGPYAEIEKACRASGGETHHIVPDMVYRLGGRPTSAAGMTSTADRIPNAPTFNQGASICLTSGEHRTDEEAVHRTLNPALHELGAVNKPTGTAPLLSIYVESVRALDRVPGVDPKCKALAKTVAGGQVASLAKQPGRTTTGLPSAEARAVLSAGGR